MKRLLVVTVFALLVSACTAAGAISAGSSPPGTQDTVDPADQGASPDPAALDLSLPVDQSLAPISRSEPGSDALLALEMCRVEPGDPRVVGMARLSSAADIARYAPVAGPELAGDYKVVWLIQLQGDFPSQRTQTAAGEPIMMPNPTCAVLDGDPYFYASHGSWDGDVYVAPTEVKDQPSEALPPMNP